MRRDRDAVGVERGGEWGGVSPPQPTKGVVSSPSEVRGRSGVRGRAPAENEFGVGPIVKSVAEDLWLKENQVFCEAFINGLH